MINNGVINNSLTRGNKAEIVGWVMPDYSSGITATITTDGFIAPTDGLFVLAWNNGNTQNGISINGVDPQYQWKLYLDCQYLVSKGDIITFSAGGSINVKFFPLKGVNNA